MKLPPTRKRNYALALLYKAMFNRVTKSVGPRAKLRLLLDLTWMFERLSANASYAFYDTLEHPGRKNTWQLLSSHVNANDSVLDIGCSHGHYTALIASRAKRVVGVDHNPKSIAIAKRTYQRPNLEFHNGDALQYLNANEQHFDLLVLTHVLEHLEEPDQFLLRFKRFFRNIYIEVPDAENSQLNQFRQDVGTPYVYSDEDHKWEFTRDELVGVLSSAGLKIIEEKRGWGVQTFYVAC